MTKKKLPPSPPPGKNLLLLTKSLSRQDKTFSIRMEKRRPPGEKTGRQDKELQKEKIINIFFEISPSFVVSRVTNEAGSYRVQPDSVT